MSKISEIPKFIWQQFLEYFSDQVLLPEGFTTSYLIGPRIFSIASSGTYWLNFFIKNENEFLKVQFSPTSTSVFEDNLFKFKKGILFSMISESETFENGSEVYLRKDSKFHEWYENIEQDNKPYINLNKYLIYLGKIYKISSESNLYYLEVRGFDDYMVSALPEHQQSIRIKELFRLYYDKIYSDIYNRKRDLFSMLDAMEIDENFLWLFAKQFNIELSDNISIQRKREFIRDIIFFLKRKGTFTSIYIIWFLLCLGTNNRLNIYERWHSYDVNGDPTSYFEDYLYQGFYNIFPDFDENLTAGTSYYEHYFDINNYPVYNRTFTKNNSYIYHGLNTNNILIQIIDTDDNKYIIPNKIKIINTNTIYFESDLTGNFDVLFATADYYIIKNSTTNNETFTINHGLNDENLIVECFDLTQNKEKIYPYDIEILDSNSFNITFSEISSYLINVCSSSSFETFTSTTSAEFDHNLNSTEGILFSIVDSSDNKIIFENETEKIDANTILSTFSSTTSAIESGIAPDFYKNCSLSTETSGKMLSSHYRVEMDISAEPLEFITNDFTNSKIIGEDLIDEILKFWNISKPVSRYVHYNYLLKVPGNLSNSTQSGYPIPFNEMIKTSFLRATNTLIEKSGTNLRQQEALSTSWIIYHNLNSYNLLIQIYDNNFNYIKPKDITILTRGSFRVDFDIPQKGWIFIVNASETSSVTSDEIVHNLNNTNLIVQVLDFNKNHLNPVEIEILDSNTIQIETNEVGPFEVLIAEADFTFNESSSASYIINHGLGTINLIIQCYDTNTKKSIYPKNINIIDIDNIEIELFDTLDIDIQIKNIDFLNSGIGTSLSLTHGQNLSSIITQTYSSNELIIPLNISSINTNTINCIFNESISVNVLGVTPDFIKSVLIWQVNHSLGDKDILTDFDTLDLIKFNPDNVKLLTSNSLDVSLSEMTSGYVQMRASEYRFDKSTPSKIWSINHNLDYFANYIQVFDEDDNLIYPKNIVLVDSNNCYLEFETNTKGYALFISIANINYNNNYLTDLRTGYWKIGNTSDYDFDPLTTMDLDSSQKTGTFFDVYEDDIYLYLDIKTSFDNDLNLTEVGLFGNSYGLLFYSKIKDLFIPKGIEVILHFKIDKRTY